MKETSAGTAPTLENTRTRPAVELSSSAAFLAFVSPGQPGRTAANSYEVASVPPVAGDDPVNESDPSGEDSRFTPVTLPYPTHESDEVYTPFYNYVKSGGRDLTTGLSTLWNGLYAADPQYIEDRMPTPSPGLNYWEDTQTTDGAPPPGCTLSSFTQFECNVIYEFEENQAIAGVPTLDVSYYFGTEVRDPTTGQTAPREGSIAWLVDDIDQGSLREIAYEAANRLQSIYEKVFEGKTLTSDVYCGASDGVSA